MKKIKGFENLYAITKEGEVYSLKRKIFLKHLIKRNGYHQVVLYSENTPHYKAIHRLVAEHFLDNPNNYPQINHIDGNKNNNNLDNLEWCTAKQNAYHRDYVLKREYVGFAKRKVYCYETNKIYLSTMDASRDTKCDNSSITKVCRGKQKHTHNFHFKYIE